MYRIVTRELDRELSFYSTYKISSLRIPEIDSKESIPPTCVACAGNFWTIYGGQAPSRKRVLVPARQAT
jgi:hypothetical protein